MSDHDKYTNEQIIEALNEANGLISIAAKKLNCSRQTIYNRAKKIVSVNNAIDDARMELVDLGELALRSAILNKEPWAVSLVLKTIGKGRGYVERIENTFTEPVFIKVVRDNKLK
jgi:hypothetical protein